LKKRRQLIGREWEAGAQRRGRNVYTDLSFMEKGLG